MRKSKQGKNVVIYARGVPDSIERQLQACRQYVAETGMTVVEEVTEQKAKPSDRLSPSQFLKKINARPDAVIVTSLDRLSRRRLEVQDWLDSLAKQRIRIVSLAQPTRRAR